MSVPPDLAPIATQVDNCHQPPLSSSPFSSAGRRHEMTNTADDAYLAAPLDQTATAPAWLAECDLIESAADGAEHEHALRDEGESFHVRKDEGVVRLEPGERSCGTCRGRCYTAR